MQFTRIRLSGFKSFVDPTELKIEPGLTGIVGPNGCGKSNLIEALRWVMGENSPKSMRASGMDDVIFSGTEQRPQRNLAEVTVALDNSDRRAPALFNDEDSLEITRRIEREAGSAYRVNGREVRAKDVQLLFADAATGAHSPALVSQGRVGALISAKPRDRRAILEEAAGISGLHARRKEAEQRLRAAENNLLRLQDVVRQMEAQIDGLKRQARQARRYRNISDHIARAEAGVLFIKWRRAADESASVEKRLEEANRALAELTAVAGRLSAEQAELAAALPDARNAEAEAAAKRQRLLIERDNLAAEEERQKERRASLSQHVDQIRHDNDRECEARDDARAAIARLDKESRRINASAEAEREKNTSARQALNDASTTANQAESEFDEQNEAVAGARARKASIESDLTAVERRADRLRLDRENLSREIESLAGEEADSEAALAAEKAARQAASEMESAGKRLEDAEEKAEELRARREDSRDRLSVHRSIVKGLEAEADALRRLLGDTDHESVDPAINSVSVRPGYERALGAALGDDLQASLDNTARRHWTELPPLSDAPDLPKEATPLNEVVTAPAALARRLSQVGVVEADHAADLARELQAGQRLVTRDGALWRWDGYSTAADAPSSAALRLQQKNRLEEVSAEKAEADQELEQSVIEAEKAEQAVRSADESVRLARADRNRAETGLSEARKAQSEAEKVLAQRSSRLSALKNHRERLNRDLAEAERRQKKLTQSLSDLPNIERLEKSVAQKRQAVEQARSRLSEARAAFDSLRREAEARQERLQALDAERDAWKLRLERAEKQIGALAERLEQTRSELAELDDDPAKFERRRQALGDALEAAERERKTAADALAEAESRLAEKERELRHAEARVSEARESQIRLEAAQENASDRCDGLAERITERFGCTPLEVLSHVGIDDADALDDLDKLEARFERLKRERERLGAVNLRAEEELEDITRQLDHLMSEHADLEAAIARLRQAISSLNREGRERLVAAFSEVNQHFDELFKTLFVGGTAHIAMVESDDPLDAGIEIMASPPGKKLQTLSLLSGGEQALTALSLIFAVFMTNPAPICVLDEVDAPLDDANVERFCDLLIEMVRRTQTRFILVTHNAVSMARMHRLFGVTMAERGVSQLVSVDLERAEQLREAV